MQVEDTLKTQSEEKIPAGYQLTEVGIIPEDWEVRRLGKFSDVTKLAGFEYSKHFNSYKDGGSIIVLRGTNITNNKLDLTDVKRIPESTSKMLKRSKLYRGDLVFAYVGTIGPVYLVEENDRFHLGPNTSKISIVDHEPNYIFNYFKSRLIHKEIFLHTSIGAQPSLSMTKIRKFKVALPPTLAEQTAIATALSDMDALIEAQEALLAKKRALKQGAMQELLTGKRRLVETDCTSWQQTEVGRIPGDWIIKKVNDLLELLTDYDANGSFSSVAENVNVLNGRGFAWYVRSTDLENITTSFDVKYVDENSYRFLKKTPLFGGELLFLKRGDIGKVYFFKMKTEYATLAPNLYLLKINNQSTPKYLYYYFLSDKGQKKLKAKNASSTLGALYKDDVKSIKVPLPPTLAEQSAIARVYPEIKATSRL